MSVANTETVDAGLTRAWASFWLATCISLATRLKHLSPAALDSGAQSSLRMAFGRLRDELDRCINLLDEGPL